LIKPGVKMTLKRGKYAERPNLVCTGWFDLVEDGAWGGFSAGEADSFAKKLWGDVGVIFEKPAEVEFILEAENMGDFFYSFGRHVQLAFCFDDDPFGN